MPNIGGVEHFFGGVDILFGGGVIANIGGGSTPPHTKSVYASISAQNNLDLQNAFVNNK